ncbi:MAG: hypothetical protein NC230_04445 [Bacteroides sp.]|nr:hypothetical protein [Bacteroides sp.]
MNSKCKNANKGSNNQTKSVDNLPGVAINIADNDCSSERLVKERTKTLNNNPRNNE